MKINTNFLTKLSRTIHKTGYKINAKSPEILMVTGTIGVIVGTVMACKATLKVNEKLEQPKEDIEKIHEAAEKGVTEAGEEYTEVDAKSDLRTVYVKTGVEVVKTYLPAVIVTGLSLYSFNKSYKIMAKRCVTLAAVAKSWETAYKEYRGRVIERFGTELDRELRCNARAVEIEEKIINENGEEETKKTIVEEVDQPSDYAFFFDEACRQFTKDPKTNRLIIEQAEKFFNQKLKGQGYLFLNEIREYFGLPILEIGQVSGWIYDEDNLNGDNYVDLGLYRPTNNEKLAERRDAFISGHERNILIDPNCDGYILDKI